MYKRSVKVADENKKRLSTVLNNQITAMDEVLSNVSMEIYYCTCYCVHNYLIIL